MISFSITSLEIRFQFICALACLPGLLFLINNNVACLLIYHSCSLGFNCPEGSTSETECPVRYFCTSPEVEKVLCSTSGAYAKYCPAGSVRESICRSGYYCPSTQQETACVAGEVCVPGSFRALACPLGSYCEATSSFAVPCQVQSINIHSNTSFRQHHRIANLTTIFNSDVLLT